MRDDVTSPDPSPDRWPPVSVIMPVLNEERHLAEAVSAALAQDYPGELEVVMALGPSHDRTDAVAAELAAADSRVRTVANPSGRTPAGLNVALSASRHEVVVRVDGHGVLSPGYIRRAVELLRDTGADNVGGVMAAAGTTPFEHAVAAAMTSPLGVGAARFHTGGQAGPAKTVYLGVFRRATLARLGGYDEAFDRAQDWELNHRIRASGGLVWFSPELQVSYRPRASVRALARQYFHYGRWRRVVMRRHAGTVSMRYLAPPLALAGCVLGLVAGVVGVLVGMPLLVLGFLAPGGYLAAVLAASARLAPRVPASARPWLPVVLSSMHMSWGLGFLTSRRRLPTGAQRPVKPSSSSV
jgi:succinoglycan biosynthesis protein ExoA